MTGSMTCLQRRVRIANARDAGVRWRSYAAFGGLSALVVLGLAALPLPLPSSAWRAFLAGVVLGVSAMALLVSGMRLGDPLVRGELAEQRSVTALSKAGRWLVTSNLAFDGMDVDHVAVTPAGVLAVETKYRGAGYSAQVDQQRHRRQLTDAARGARLVKLLLRSKMLNDRAAVLPVLIVWGPGKPTLERGYHLDQGEVYVLDGEHPQLWAHLFSTPQLGKDLQASLHSEIQQYAQVRTNYANGRQPGASSAMWTAFRAGVTEAKTQRHRRRELLKTLASAPPPACEH